MRRLPAARLLAALGLSLVGCSAEPSAPPLSSARTPIAGGELDREHDEVVELIVEWGSSGVSLCTGTLIAPNLVLTARHCVAGGGGDNVTCGSSPFSAAVAGSAVHATTADSPSQSSEFYTGRRVSVPPNGDDLCGFDLALITLLENVPPDIARPAVPRIDLRAVSGESYTALGFGVDELGNSTGGRMRLDGLIVQCTAERCSGFDLAATEFVGGAGVCVGDSGGPALDLERRVIGVLSRGSDPCETPVYGAVAGFRDWIMETALAAAETGGYEPPFWALSGSSDRPPGAAGDPCASSDECGEATVCYYESDPLDAVCTTACSESAECASPARCVPGFDAPGGGLCLAPSRPTTEDPGETKRPPGDADSCSIRASSSRGSAFPLVLSLVGLALVARRRVLL